MNATQQKTVGEIVAEDYRAAAVFESFGIDFCCKVNKTIDEACETKKVSPEALNDALAKLQNETKSNLPDFASWPLDLLVDYIEKKHHRYISETTPVLMQFLDKLCNVHGSRHPELFEIAKQFNASAGELAMHMKKEEMILFPYVKRLVKAAGTGIEPEKPAFGTAENPVHVLMQEHDTEGERFREISDLSNNYTPPQDGCTTYRVAFQMLKEFENDLHLHIHLENNILFPQTIHIEQKIFHEQPHQTS